MIGLYVQCDNDVGSAPQCEFIPFMQRRILPTTNAISPPLHKLNQLTMRSAFHVPFDTPPSVDNFLVGYLFTKSSISDLD